ncbi:MAG TPA: hypothetical protein VHZ51_30530 [Ktedonobacteraceae bacterium]|nr:hypothetical protein [Ktedonobacteraceae bacterium]
MILGNKLSGSASDHYLARTGYQSQQTSQPEDPHRPNNLWAPVDDEKDHGAHGSFNNLASNNLARDQSWQLWANEHRDILALVAVSVVSLLMRLLAKKSP